MRAANMPSTIASPTTQDYKRREALTTSQISRAWVYGAGAMIAAGALLQSRDPPAFLGAIITLAVVALVSARFDRSETLLAVASLLGRRDRHGAGLH